VEVSTNDTLKVNDSTGDDYYMCVASNVVGGKQTNIYSRHIYFKAGGKPDYFFLIEYFWYKRLILAQLMKYVPV